MPDYELLVVGDGCTDDSEKVVAAIKDPRVRWINLPVNTGHQAGPNNRGIEEARGEYIAYLGHDDLWLPHHLQCMIDKLDEAGAGVAHSLLVQVFPGRHIGTPVMPMLDHRTGGPPSCTIYRRCVTDKIGGWKNYRDLNVAPELDLLRRAQGAGFQELFVPRFTVMKFPASQRENVYRDRPHHEQATWLERIQTDPDFESVELVRMIMAGEVVHATPARTLVRILLAELRKRLAWRMSRRSGLKAVFWKAKGGGIDHVKRYKGL
jgi:GT2 family glycosyltransferase